MQIRLHENGKTLILVSEDKTIKYVTPETLPQTVLTDIFNYIKKSFTANGMT